MSQRGLAILEELKLRLTVRALRAKAITKWLCLSSDSVQEAFRQPEQDLVGG